MVFLVIACLLPSFLVAYFATAAMRRIAPRVGLIDQPAARKFHVNPTPLGGGVGIWLGVLLPIAAAQLAAIVMTRHESLRALIPANVAIHLDGVLYRSGQMWAILLGGTILSAMGLIDDLRNLPWQPRLALQACIAGGLAAYGVRATVFASQPWIGITISILWMMVLVNSFNFLDNMDGLSAGIALVAASVLSVVMLTSTSEPRWLVAGVLLTLVGSLGGFLCHNRPPARIFMGDSGSYFIGLMMATMTIRGTFYESSSGGKHVILVPLCILAVPLYDFCSVMVIRLLQKRSPFRPDKSHFSHRLVELGLSSPKAVLTIYLATLTTGLGGLLLYQVPGWSGAILVIALILCVLAIVAILETVGRKRNGDGGKAP